MFTMTIEKKIKQIRMNIHKTIKVLIIAGVTLLSACTDWGEHYDGSISDTQNLIQRLESIDGTDEFLTVLKSTGLDKVVAGSDVYTLFIPPVGSFTDVADDELKQLVGNHIVFGRLFKENMTDSLKIRAVNGKFLRIYVENEIPKINNRMELISIDETNYDFEAQNGVIQRVDKLITVVQNLEEKIQTLDPEKYSIFLENYSKYDSLNIEEEMYDIAFNDDGGVILYTEPLTEYACFNAADEENGYTLLAPTNDAILAQKAELLALNGGDESKISPYYYMRLIRNHMLRGAFNNNQLFAADTIISEGENWVVGRKLTEENFGTPVVASNGYLFESNHNVYKPIAADFIDSIVYEAEWSVGFDNHEKTLVYDCANLPEVEGNGTQINHHLFIPGLNGGDRLDFFIPQVFEGLYQVKIVYKWTGLQVSVDSEEVPISEWRVNLETYVLKDLTNEDPNYWAYGDFGIVFFPEPGNLNIGIQINSGMLEALMIDKIVLVPLEY